MFGLAAPDLAQAPRVGAGARQDAELEPTLSSSKNRTRTSARPVIFAALVLSNQLLRVSLLLCCCCWYSLRVHRPLTPRTSSALKLAWALRDGQVAACYARAGTQVSR